MYYTERELTAGPVLPSGPGLPGLPLRPYRQRSQVSGGSTNNGADYYVIAVVGNLTLAPGKPASPVRPASPVEPLGPTAPGAPRSPLAPYDGRERERKEVERQRLVQS